MYFRIRCGVHGRKKIAQQASGRNLFTVDRKRKRQCKKTGHATEIFECLIERKDSIPPAPQSAGILPKKS